MKIKGVILLLIFIALVPSCQTLDKEKRGPLLSSVEEVSVEEVSFWKKIEAWEGYMRLIGNKDISMSTLMRLTEGYLEAKEILYKNDMEEYEERMVRYNKGYLKTEPGEPEQDYSYFISQFKKLQVQYHYVNGADSIRYALGYVLYEQGEVDEAVSVFEDLVRNYPQSDYFIEVSFRLGEFYFETGQMGEALEAYGRVLNFPQSVFYDKAIYKLGWVYYKLDELKKAVDAFMVIVDRTWEGELKEGGLMESAFSGMIMSLSHFKSISQAIEYLKFKGLRGYTPLVFTRLLDMLIDEARYKPAIYVFNSLTELFPDNPDLPFVYEKMAELYERIGDKEAALTASIELAYRYNPTTSWYKKNYSADLEMLDALVSKTILSISKRYYLISKKEEDLDNLENAIKGYRDFLVFFPQSADYKKINLLLADILFDAGMYKKAAKEYEKVILLYQEGPERTEIAYSLFLTYEVIFNRFEEIRDETVRSVRQVLETYRSDFSKSDRLEKVLYRMADMYSIIGHLDKARENLIPITKGKDPLPAYKKIAKLYIAEDNLGAAERVYAKLLKRSKDSTLKEQLASLRYRIAEEYLEAGRYNDAAAKFNQAFNAYPGFEVGEAALMRLGYIHIQKKDLDLLKGVVKRLVKVYPDSDGAVSLLVEAGRGLEKDEPLKAARFYEDASALSKDTKDTGKLIFASAMLYERNGETRKAERLFKRYLFSKEGYLENYAEVLYRLGYIQLETGRKKEGIEMLTSLVEWKGQIDDRLVAKAGLLLLKEKQAVYRGIKLTPPFEETLERKTLLLDTLLKEYSDIAGYKVPELLPEVFYQMGMILENFRDSLINSERPHDLTQGEMEEYNSLLEEKAFQYDEQAVNAYERSMLVGRKLMIFDEWVEKSLSRLRNIRPVLHKREFEEKWMEPIFIYPEPVTLER